MTPECTPQWTALAEEYSVDSLKVGVLQFFLPYYSLEIDPSHLSETTQRDGKGREEEKKKKTKWMIPIGTLKLRHLKPHSGKMIYLSSAYTHFCR